MKLNRTGRLAVTSTLVLVVMALFATFVSAQSQTIALRDRVVKTPARARVVKPPAKPPAKPVASALKKTVIAANKNVPARPSRRTASPAKVGYVLEYGVEPTYLVVNLNTRVTRLALETSSNMSCEGDRTRMSPLLRQLSDVPGVTGVTLQEYEIGITKGVAFEWNKVIPSVMKVLSKNLANNKELAQLRPPIHYRERDRDRN